MMGFSAPRIYDDDFAKIQIGRKLLESNFLHKLIREQGGAYGSGT